MAIDRAADRQPSKRDGATEPVPSTHTDLAAAWMHVARRLAPLTSTLLAFGARSALGWAVDRLRPPSAAASHARRQRAAYRVRSVAMELSGGLLIKAGQTVAGRADLVPDDVVEALSVLEEGLRPRPFRVIARQITRELGQPWREVFAELDTEPLGAGSLAQVHRGRLKDGREVAVKILYPHVEDSVARELRLMPAILAWLIPPDQGVNLERVLEEIRRFIPGELDLRSEARNAERIASVLAHRRDVVVPSVIWQWTSRRLLVMSVARGIKVTDMAELRRAGIDPRAVGDLLMDVYCEQVFRAGVFHADPHAGNLRVMPGPRLAMFDFGVVKTLPETTRRALGQLVETLSVGDLAGAESAMDALGFRTAQDDPASLLAFARLFVGTFRPGRGYADPRLVMDADRRLRAHAAANPIVEVPPDLVLVGRVIGILSGLGKRLDSRADLFGTMRRHITALR
jgi:predicted unusual protein kinase regulating ubiquinone biosynthesis (AarF/ABC1/UbiB family)